MFYYFYLKKINFILAEKDRIIKFSVYTDLKATIP